MENELRLLKGTLANLDAESSEYRRLIEKHIAELEQCIAALKASDCSETELMKS